jgi:polyisoprenoid-binding protein YceI
MQQVSQGEKGLSTVGMPQTTVRYLIEGRRSTFKVRAFAAGLLSALGHNPTIAIPDFEGEVVFNPDAVEQSSLKMVIHAASLAVADDIRERDRMEINRTMQQEVLESDSFPEIVYECSQMSVTKTGEGQYAVTLNGELTLHGVTRRHTASACISAIGETLRASGDLCIRQSDYEIRPVSAVGGTIKLKDELKLSFDIYARKGNMSCT